jgi:hypothetical protein
MMNNIEIFSEPLLEFRHGQTLQDPHDGLSLFGPYEEDFHPKNISYGIIGPPDGIQAFSEWASMLNGPIFPEEGKDTKLWPPYKGFELIYHSEWPNKPSWSYPLDRKALLIAAKHRDPHKRTFDVVKQYLDGIPVLKKKDSSIGFLVCIVPDEVWKNCRPKSRINQGWGYKPKKKELRQRMGGQKSLSKWMSESIDENDWDSEQYHLSIDFRRQIKAKSMYHGIPIQIIRESTIDPGGLYVADVPKRGLTPASDLAWNLSTAFYYKSGAKPWKLANAREGVCYIGLAFRRVQADKDNRTACCAAQMFLDSGDGIVFLGDEGPWYSPKTQQCHLSQDGAKELLEGILETYVDLEGKKLTEIFLHSRSSINESEYHGYQNACPSGVKLTAINVQLERTGIRLFREGHKPVMRGTFWKWNENKGYLWGSGYAPKFGTYTGLEIPAPMKIEIQHGTGDIQQVAKDIFSLTKLNYNACKLGDSEPVTIKFSNAVGEILVSNPHVHERRPQFKFYI